jgi:tRNA (cytidine/uridine-2'-O-)-methyltransferase
MFHVVLVEPEIPPNTGNVIRLCANSAATLHLVKPLGFRLDAKSLRRSGLDYHDLAEVKVHGSLEDCLECLGGARWFAVETGGRHCYSDLAYRAGDAFFFGPETRGLAPAMLLRLGEARSVAIPMRPGSRSLNLSNAVSLVVYEAWRQSNFAGRSDGTG